MALNLGPSYGAGGYAAALEDELQRRFLERQQAFREKLAWAEEARRSESDKLDNELRRKQIESLDEYRKQQLADVDQNNALGRLALLKPGQDYGTQEIASEAKVAPALFRLKQESAPGPVQQGEPPLMQDVPGRMVYQGTPEQQKETQQKEYIKGLINSLPAGSPQRMALEYQYATGQNAPNALFDNPDAELQKKIREKRALIGAGLERDPTRPPQLTPYQEFQETRALANDWAKVNGPVKEMERQMRNMEAGLSEFERGNTAAGAQAVLVTFQKILDPTSVVRESEYMRSAAGMSLENQIRGYVQRLSSGGAGVPYAELKKFVDTAKRMLGSMKGVNEPYRKRISSIAKRFEIPEENIFSDYEDPASAPAPGAATPPPAAPSAVASITKKR